MGLSTVVVAEWIFKRITDKTVDFATDALSKRIGIFEITCRKCGTKLHNARIPENQKYALRCLKCENQNEIMIDSLDKLTIFHLQQANLQATNANILVQAANIVIPGTNISINHFPGYYQIISIHSGKCLDVDGQKMGNGANVHQWSWWGGDNQRWKITGADNGYFYLFAKHSKMVLDVNNEQTQDGANVQQWSFHGGDNQQWKFMDADDGNYHIIAKHSRKCLDVSEWKTENGGNIIQWSFHGGNNQKWKLIQVEQ